MLDEEIGRFLALVGDDVSTFVFSDHGSMAMDGCFCINEWLIQKGYLVLKGPPPARGTPIEKTTVDWSKTMAWGAGGYYARIFYNVKGREPEGILPAYQIPAITAKLTKDLEAVRLPNGQPLAPEVRSPAKIYREVTGDAPDLMIYFSKLKWRSAGTLGHGGLFLSENDTGPDDSVHSFDGIFVLAEPGRPARGALGAQSILDVAPTILTRMGAPIPARMQGKPIPELL